MTRYALAALTAVLLAGSALAAHASDATDVRVLSDSDAKIYRDAIDDERAGYFRDAQADLERVSDQSLRG